MRLPSPATRQYLYRVVLAVVPLLVIGGILAPAQVDLWLALAAAVLGVGGAGLANTALKRQRENGSLDE